ncbi:MAG: restriction endonuclease, partial [bacterium]
MNELQWSILDDEWFVSLASDLLRDNGYVIRYQGDGPDGGVDIFATQPISFGFDIQPFTWAVQCKFSKSPKAAVNDKEIRDVEGILRSS